MKFHLITQRKPASFNLHAKEKRQGLCAARREIPRSQTGLAPGASAAHRRRMADKKSRKGRGPLRGRPATHLRQRRNGVFGGLQRGLLGAPPLRGPLCPRGRLPARQGKRPTAQPGTIPTYYIIILNHRQTLCFQPNPLHRQNGKVRIHLHAVRHGIRSPTAYAGSIMSAGPKQQASGRCMQ